MDPNVERENMAKGCRRAVIVALGLIIGMIAFVFLASCKVATQAIIPEGKVLERDGDRYLVIWKDMGDKPHAYAYNWVYQPGLGLAPVEDLEVFIIIQPKIKQR